MIYSKTEKFCWAKQKSEASVAKKYELEETGLFISASDHAGSPQVTSHEMLCELFNSSASFFCSSHDTQILSLQVTGDTLPFA
jgi:hypothetical protein